MSTIAQLDLILETVVANGGPAIPNRQGTCIQTTRQGVYLFRYLGYEARPLVVHQHFENENWVVGTGGISGMDPTKNNNVPGPNETRYGLHVVTLLPNERVIVDFSCGQISRPERGLWLDKQVQVFEFMPELYKKFMAGSRINSPRGNGMLYLQVHPDQESFRNTEAWQQARQTKRESRQIVKQYEKRIARGSRASSESAQFLQTQY
jgi:hypothetical protein